MKIVLATRNPSKVEQIKGIFNHSGIEIVTLDQAYIVGEAVEDGKTLRVNALKKAGYAWQRLRGEPRWAMADDTGLFITALGGKPGVYSARWAGENADTDEITAYTLKQLQGVTDRSATFRTVVAVVDPNGRAHIFEGICEGSILETPRVRPQPKMPYSPIFVPSGTQKVWAEMSVDEENEISHRGKAFRKVHAFLSGANS